MIIKSLKLTNFRNHQKFETEFSSGVSLILGPNGTGKTNILEAVNLLSTGKSFRARYDYEMIYDPKVTGQKNVNHIFNGGVEFKEFARTVGIVSDADHEDTLEISIVRDDPKTYLSRKLLKINGTPKRVSDASNYFSTVLFTPQDLEIFIGPPSLRRHFLDTLLYKIDKKYRKEHTLYIKAVRQRNKVLEKINKTGIGNNELPFWTDKILQSGIYIQKERAKMCKMLTLVTERTYSTFSSQKGSTKIEYKINEINEERLNEHRTHEIQAKATLVGPHRDDFELLINGYNTAQYGSRGQQRTLALSLKVAELNLVKEKTISPPVLLLDDIFSELDDAHKEALSKLIGSQQTLITSAESPSYLHLAGNMQILL